MAIAVRCKSCGRLFRASNGRRGETAACTHCAAQLLIDGRDVPDVDVFVSHSTKDKDLADAVVTALEAAKLRCWVAPRDIAPGAEWGSAIVDAIANSRIMVLVYSAHSNASPQVLREVERAVSKGVAITPLRIDGTPLSKGMEYYISTCHWLDAQAPPLDQHMGRLVRTVRGLIDQDYEVAKAPRPLASEPSQSPVGGESSAALTPPRRRSVGKSPYVLAVVIAVVALAVTAAVYGPWRTRIAGLVPLGSRQAPGAHAADDLAALEARLAQACRGSARAPLEVGELVRSDVQCTANDKGYSLAGTVQIGNSPENRHPGATARGIVVAEPGFCLEGGKLVVSNGKLDLRGTEQRPCVLIGVTIICEHAGAVRATHTLFENCTFAKGGIMYSFAGYTSKWTFENCVLRKSNFSNLQRITFGISLRTCAFVDCRLPPRHWGYAKSESPDDDGAALAKGAWSRIDACDFYRCEIAPSVFWSMNECNCFGCKVKVDNPPDTFQSRTNLDVTVGLAPGSEALTADLAANTSANGTGKVTYTAGRYLARK